MDKFFSGKQIEAARKAVGLAQKDLYQAAKVSRATYHNWVVGKSEPNVSQFLAMMQICWQRSPETKANDEFQSLIKNLVTVGKPNAIAD
ncbi:helix-turn-helix transcriptional regulator [Catenovulum agarivorans]|uniref:helix-turn-helix transcriptional regulator n=1 Tax=Catenovulum agarivorans TaxID=1172192 RepID=UPI0002E197CE|nr:helix-turn-helix transcriptional regulator [Catenovulum agarivorans]